MESPKNHKQGIPLNVIIFLLLAACGLVWVLSFFTATKHPLPGSTAATNAPSNSTSGNHGKHPAFRRVAKSSQPQTAEEQVAERLMSFNQNRRELAHRYADKLGIAVPTELEQFFDAADRGDWAEIDRLYKELQNKRQHDRGPEAEVLQKLFPTAQEIWGAHYSAQEWSAQALLDYGHDVLGSLEPGMVYLGGTDPGRFIPTLLNATSGDDHIVLTQNAFADMTYLNYVNFLYGDRLKTLDAKDSQKGFNAYLADVAKRYAHDQNFPNEPKQMRPGEDYKSENGRVQVSGQVAVMAVNEQLLKLLREKNPDLAFAMEESFSLPSTYSGAVPLGPLLQLGDEKIKVTPEQASDALRFWRERVSQLTANPEFDPLKDTGREYAHMIVAQGNLFSTGSLSSEAEQAYRLAQQLAVHDLEPVAKLYDLLNRTGRATEATQILAQFEQNHPDKSEAIAAVRKQSK